MDIGKLVGTRGPCLTTCALHPETASITQGPFAGEVKADFIKEVRGLGKK